MNSSNKYIVAALVCLAFCLVLRSSAFAEDSGAFRGKWWNYYERGLTSAEKEDINWAEADLKQAISKRDKDQRMARTYGMHFMDYFPHRELGILYYNADRLTEAAHELEESLRGEESAKAVYFLNKARKQILLKDKASALIKEPSLTVVSPQDQLITREPALKVIGKAYGKGLISRLTINGKPYPVGLAREEVEFSVDIELSEGENNIQIMAEDLLSKRSEKSFVAVLDRQAPLISITGVQKEKIDGEDYVRLRCEVSDESGIKSVLVDGAEKLTGIQKNFSLNLSYPLKQITGIIQLKASDMPGNELSANINPLEELAQAAMSERPVLLASASALNSLALFSADREPPIITIKGADNIPQVYIDKYFVEGEVSDNKEVEELRINGQPLNIKKGRKVFFSKLVKLKEGGNKITVAALDGSKNKAALDMDIAMSRPAAFQTASRMKLSLLPFQSTARGSETGSQAAEDYLTAFIVEQKRFSLIDRQHLKQVLSEQKLAAEKLTDPENTIRVGKLLAADALLATSVNAGKKSIEVITKVISTETSEVLEVKDAFSEDTGAVSVKELMEGLASKLAAAFPVVQGTVIKKERDYLFTDLGLSNKLRKNARALVFRKGGQIVHPVTGKSLGWDTIKLGEAYFEELQEDFSKIKLSDRAKGQEIRANDLVITK